MSLGLFLGRLIADRSEELRVEIIDLELNGSVLILKPTNSSSKQGHIVGELLREIDGRSCGSRSIWCWGRLGCRWSRGLRRRRYGGPSSVLRSENPSALDLRLTSPFLASNFDNRLRFCQDGR